MNFNKEFEKLSIELNMRKFSPQTKKSYIFHITKFLQNFVKPVKNITNSEVKNYLNNISEKYDENTLRLIHSSLNFFFTNILKKPNFMKIIPKAKAKQSLPKPILKSEINLILNNIKNKKHYLIVALIYSSGLRLSEIINLKRENLNTENNLIRVDNSKQKKDRLTICSKKLMKQLTNYICRTTFTTPYLFETNRNSKYCKKSIQEILKKASVNFEKNITPHTLRHSFATHLLESGCNIKYIQSLLGHSRLDTTQIYTKVAKTKLENIKNPFD